MPNISLALSSKKDPHAGRIKRQIECLGWRSWLVTRRMTTRYRTHYRHKSKLAAFSALYIVIEPSISVPAYRSNYKQRSNINCLVCSDIGYSPFGEPFLPVQKHHMEQYRPCLIEIVKEKIVRGA
jgi:hypothetical protein